MFSFCLFCLSEYQWEEFLDRGWCICVTTKCPTVFQCALSPPSEGSFSWKIAPWNLVRGFAFSYASRHDFASLGFDRHFPRASLCSNFLQGSVRPRSFQRDSRHRNQRDAQNSSFPKSILAVRTAEEAHISQAAWRDTQTVGQLERPAVSSQVPDVTSSHTVGGWRVAVLWVPLSHSYSCSRPLHTPVS